MDVFLEGDLQVDWVNLTELGPLPPLAERKRLLVATAAFIFEKVYGQRDAGLGQVLDDLSGEQTIDLERVRIEVLLSAGEYLRRFGVRRPPKLVAALRSYDDARSRRADEQRLKGPAN